MNILKINKGTRTVILIMAVLVLTGIGIAKLYYGNINASEDPRVIDAKMLYKKYNVYTQNNDYDAVYALLDSIKYIYLQFPDYKESFEIGVVYNNIGATWLSAALFEAEDINKQTCFDSAHVYCKKAVDLYENWLLNFQNLSENDINKLVSAYYSDDVKFYKGRNIGKIRNKRISDIIEAKTETPKRLSVAYTNLGIISRHNMQYDSAIEYYKKALNLWDENLTAKNNINILLGRELEERTTIEKLFPKEK